jgi:hypothetical protein
MPIAQPLIEQQQQKVQMPPSGMIKPQMTGGAGKGTLERIVRDGMIGGKRINR